MLNGSAYGSSRGKKKRLSDEGRGEGDEAAALLGSADGSLNGYEVEVTVRRPHIG